MNRHRIYRTFLEVFFRDTVVANSTNGTIESIQANHLISTCRRIYANSDKDLGVRTDADEASQRLVMFSRAWQVFLGYFDKSSWQKEWIPIPEVILQSLDRSDESK